MVNRYTAVGETVLDPFCGSGTLLVEAVAASRNAVGIDIDPLAAFVADTKVHRFAPGQLGLCQRTRCWRPPGKCADQQAGTTALKKRDVSIGTAQRQIREEGLWTPRLPNWQHWFRHYVWVDLARLNHQISEAQIPETHRDLLRLAFASVIRKVSRADPVPVSGLEVTSHMLRREEEGRYLDTFAHFENATSLALDAVQELHDANPQGRARAIRGDAKRITRSVRGPVDAVITSPPYQGAVDYYRRHKLEMYWLGLVDDRAERLALLGDYIGRVKVAHRDPLAKREVAKPLAMKWDADLKKVDTRRASGFRHYINSMTEAMAEIATVLAPGSPCVLVVGNSRWRGNEVPTVPLLREIAADFFDHEETLFYDVRNRYMSYSRHNGADIRPRVCDQTQKEVTIDRFGPTWAMR